MEVRCLLNRDLTIEEKASIVKCVSHLKESFGVSVYKVMVSPHFSLGAGKRAYSVAFVFDRHEGVSRE